MCLLSPSPSTGFANFWRREWQGGRKRFERARRFFWPELESTRLAGSMSTRTETRQKRFDGSQSEEIQAMQANCGLKQTHTQLQGACFSRRKVAGERKVWVGPVGRGRANWLLHDLAGKLESSAPCSSGALSRPPSSPSRPHQRETEADLEGRIVDCKSCRPKRAGPRRRRRRRIEN